MDKRTWRGSGLARPPSSRPAWRRYAVAVASVAACWAAREALTPVIGPTALPWITFFPAVAVAAWYGGLVPALCAVALSGLVSNWFFIEPLHSFRIVDPVRSLLAFPVAAAFIVAAIEASHRARRDLAQSRDVLATTLTSIGDGVVVTDSAGRVTFLNPEAERLTGWTVADAAGRPISEVFRIVNERTRQGVESPVEKVLRDGKVVGLANHTVVIAKDGAETPIDDSAAPVRRPGEPIEGVVLVFRDVREQRQAEAARARLASIVESSGDAILSKDLDGRVLTWNAAAERLFGRRAEEIVGRPVTMIIPQEHLDEEAAILAALRAGRPSELVETSRLAKDGRRVPVSVRVSPLRDADGEVVGASKVIRDLSDLVAARDALAREKELLATTLSSIGDGVIATDDQARVTFLNPVAEELTGWRRTEAVGARLPDIFRIVNETTRAAVENPALRAMRDGVIVGLANHTVLRAKSGEERSIDDSGAPIRDPRGRVVGSVLVFRDITERRRAERALQAAEERSRSVIDHVLDGIIAVDESGRIDAFNHAAEDLFGHAASDVVGRDVGMLVPEPYRGELTTGPRREVEGLRKDGSTFPMELAVSEFHVGDKRCFTGIVRDLTERKRHEAMLREGEARLLAIVEQLPVGVGVMDLDGRWTVSNAAMRSFAPATVPSRDPTRAGRWHTFDAAGRPVLPAAWPAARALRGDSVEPGMEFEYEKDDGALVHTIVSAIPLRDDARRVTGAIAVVQDVDRLKRMDLALRENEARFRLALQGTPVSVFTCDRDLRFTWVYNSNLPVTETSELLGKREDELLPADAVRDVMEMKRRVLVSGRGERAVVAVPHGGETSYFDCAIEPILDPDGEVVGVRGAKTDVSERLRTERALAARARLLNLTHDAILVRDAGDRITVWNHGATETYGWSEDEARGKVVHELLRTKFPRPLAEIVAAVRRDGRWAGDLVHTRRDGTQIHVASRWALDHGARGAADSIMEINIDITDRVKAETALREVDQRKNEFIATLAHELRNPLAPIKNSITLLHLKGPSDKDLVAARGVIERQVNQISRLLDDLLDVNRLGRRKLELRKEHVTLDAILTAALETARPTIDGRRHRVSVAVPQDVVLDADPLRLSQVFANLLNNAAKYMDEGGQVWVSAKRERDDVVVSVKDVGIGIAPESVQTLFEIYSQAPLALERAQGGVGIGLSLAKGLVELHGGTISARSDGIGKGSEFVVRLPIAVGAAIPPEMVAKRIKRKGGVTRRILIADDVRDNADTLAMMLRTLGHEVHVAYDGVEAIAAADRLRPDVALLDIGMPGVNGYDACRSIRGREWGKAMYLIAQTGWGQEEDRRRAEQAGFDRHMLKPVDCAALVVVLSNLPSPAADV